MTEGLSGLAYCFSNKLVPLLELSELFDNLDDLLINIHFSL